jgi:predicted transposase/invertase (TIGR01784 family)
LKIEDILIKPDEKLLDLKEDFVFKTILTKGNEESECALKSLISAFTGRNVVNVEVRENEPKGEYSKEKAIRLDVNCKFDDKHTANLEITMDAQEFEFVRLEQYVARLFGNVKGKGILYSEYPEAYQISIIGNKNIVEDSEILNYYEMCNIRTGLPINGKMHIITAELKKVDRINKKVEEMSSKERWAAYFAWCNNKNK